MESLTVSNIHGSHTYEIVEKIPSNYFVWNIGQNMEHDDYIPICQDLHPNDKDSYDINQYTLKCIKLPVQEVMLLRDAAAWGIGSLKDCKKALKSKRTGHNADQKRKHAEATIEIFERITE